MNPKELNAVVHDHDAASYDDRFMLEFSPALGGVLARELTGILGHLPRARRVLDVGCGTGYNAIGVAAAGIAGDVQACDLSMEMLRRARGNAEKAEADVSFALCDAELLPYPDDSFDMVISRGILHHVPHPLVSLIEIRRVLEPGGTALLLGEPTPGGEAQAQRVVGAVVKVVERARRLARVERTAADDEHLAWELATMAANLHTFEPGEVAALAEKAGFEDITVQTWSLVGVYVMAVAYYLSGEFESLSRNRFTRGTARTLGKVASGFDRRVSDRYLPPEWRHAIRAVLR